ncbi:MAG: hypothetical protein C4291_04740 [Candidatus Dadabacteria bacterium]
MKGTQICFSRLRIRAALLVILMIFFIPPRTQAAGPQIPYSFFLENPYSITGIRANVELVDLDSPPSGALIMNQYRVDINLFKNLIGVYAKFPFTGVVNFGPGTFDSGTGTRLFLANEKDDYNFGNIGIGAKLALLNLDYAILTGGFEVLIPTARDGFGAEAARAYFRDLPYFVKKATTLSPYLVLGTGAGIFGFQANFGAEIITNAERIEGDNTELRFKYGVTGSVTPELPVPFSISFLLEALFVSTTSFNNNHTEAFITPGIRLGGKIVSVGMGVQIPVGQNVNDFANADYFLDLIIRFGT